jgi:predicted PurR-regulated permease PerM
MKWNDKKPYLYGMLAGFGAISLSVLFFFVIYRFKGFSGGIHQLMGILSPFVYGAAIAYVLKPVCNFYGNFLQKYLPEKGKKLVGGLSVTLSILTALLIVYLLFIMIIPQLVSSVLSLVYTVPGRVDTFMAWLQNYLESDPQLQKTINDVYSNVAVSLDDWIKTSVIPYLRELLNGFGAGLMNFVSVLNNTGLGLIVAVYLLMSRHKYSRQAKMVLYSVVRRDWADVIHEELSYANRVFEGFISGKLLDSLIIGILCYVFMLIARMPSAMLISVIIGITNIIPFFGPFIGAIPSILLLLIDNPIQAVWFTIFIIILQQFDGNVLGPKILGNSTGLSSFWVLFSILLFGGLWGFVGMIVGVPFFAVIYDILRKLIFRGLHHNGCEEMLVHYNECFGEHPAAPEPPAPPKAGAGKV